MEVEDLCTVLGTVATVILWSWKVCLWNFALKE